MRKSLKVELSQMTTDQLSEQIKTIRKEMFDLRMKRLSAPVKDVHMARKLRKSLACALTFLQQKSV